MVDSEIARLRKLRNAALRARTLAKSFDSSSTTEHSLYAKSALICWSIARVATGTLRSHPFLSYRQDPSQLRALTDGLLAAIVSLGAQRQNRSRQVISRALQIVAREVDDARALTRSPDLSDALGRMQVQLRRLLQELGVDLRLNAAAGIVQPASARLASETNWPYLAI